MFLRLFSASETVAVEVLDTFLFLLKVSLNGLKNQFPIIKFNKFLAKALLPFLFKCSFLMRR